MTQTVLHNQKTAYLFFVEIPQEDAVVFAATYHPLALGVCCNEGSKETEVLIHMTCRAQYQLSSVHPHPFIARTELIHTGI
jgi:hypothetical protein